jgi:hypothetical protein
MSEPTVRNRAAQHPPLQQVAQRVPGRAWAAWNPNRGVWETDQLDLFQQREPYSRPWPSSGLMLGGSVYPLPESGRLTNGSGSSSSPGGGSPPSQVPVLLRTPLASDSIRGNEPIWHIKARRGTITLSHQLIDLALHGPDGSVGPDETLLTATLDFLHDPDGTDDSGMSPV